MFSTIASSIFIPTDSVLKSVDAMKLAHFKSGPVIGANPSTTNSGPNLLYFAPRRVHPSSQAPRQAFSLGGRCVKGETKLAHAPPMLTVQTLNYFRLFMLPML